MTHYEHQDESELCLLRLCFLCLCFFSFFSFLCLCFSRFSLFSFRSRLCSFFSRRRLLLIIHRDAFRQVGEACIGWARAGAI